MKTTLTVFLLTIIVAMSLMGQMHAEAALETSIKAYWKLDDTAGSTTAVNSETVQGAALDGTLLGGPTLAQFVAGGQSGNALDFDGANDAVKLPTPAFFTNSVNDLTVIYWFKRNTLTPLTNSISNQDSCACGPLGTNSTGGLQVMHGIGANGSTIVRFYKAGERNFTVGTTQDTNWHHIAIVGSGGNTLEVYLDGIATLSPSSPNFSFGPFDMLTTHEMELGNAVQSSSGFFDGLIDDVAIYDRPLTGDEVKTTFNYGSTGDMQNRRTFLNTAIASGALIGLNYGDPEVIAMNFFNSQAPAMGNFVEVGTGVNQRRFFYWPDGSPILNGLSIGDSSTAFGELTIRLGSGLSTLPNPEPATMAIFGMGLVGLFFKRRFRH